MSAVGLYVRVWCSTAEARVSDVGRNHGGEVLGGEQMNYNSDIDGSSRFERVCYCK